MNQEFWRVMKDCNTPGTHCVAVKFGEMPILIWGGNQVPLQSVRGFLVVKDQLEPGKSKRLTPDDLTGEISLKSVELIAAFDFAGVPPKSVLAELIDKNTERMPPAVQELRELLSLYLYGEMQICGTRYAMTIAYVRLSSEGGDGGILLSPHIIGQRQMRTVTRLLMDGGE